MLPLFVVLFVFAIVYAAMMCSIRSLENMRLDDTAQFKEEEIDDIMQLMRYGHRILLEAAEIANRPENLFSDS